MSRCTAARSRHRPAHDLRRLSGADLRRHDRRQPVLRAAPSPRAAAELQGAAAEAFKRDILEAERSGNLPFDSEADWIDYESAGLSGPEEVVPAAVRALAMVRLDRDVYHMGLRGTIDPEAQPEVAAAVLRRAAPCASGSRTRASAAWSRCSTRTLQRQRDARREPAVRRPATRPSTSSISPPIRTSSRPWSAPA